MTTRHNCIMHNDRHPSTSSMLSSTTTPLLSPSSPQTTITSTKTLLLQPSSPIPTICRSNSNFFTSTYIPFISSLPSLFLFLFFLFSLLPLCFSHGCMSYPNPRGSLTTRTDFITHLIDPDAPVDYFPHFPAGPRSSSPGAGIRHQRLNAGHKGWVPFEPVLDRSFSWRAGVCGDSKQGPREHLKGGVYYYDGEIVASYQQGGYINIEMAINAHHNGYIVMHVCDISKCPDNEISETCFRKGFCYRLQRAYVKECDDGYSKRCGPIDRNFKDRWYLPCYGFKDGSSKIARYGMQGTMKYKLPDHLQCAHCVLHWYWTSANTCNPPGVLEYFDGPDAPKSWGNCPGQGGALGGVARGQRECGGNKLPEEYYMCADIKISASSSSSETTVQARKPKPKPKPKPRAPRKPRVAPPKKKKKKSTPTKPSQPRKGGYDERAGFKRGSRAVRDVILIDRGRRIASLNVVNKVRVSKYSRLSIEALTEPQVKRVSFRVNKGKVYIDGRKPFFIRGDKNGRPYRFHPPMNKWITLSVYADGDTDYIKVYFQKY